MFGLEKLRVLKEVSKDKHIYTVSNSLKDMLSEYEKMVWRNEESFLSEFSPNENITDIANLKFTKSEVEVTYIKNSGLLITDSIYFDDFISWLHKELKR